MPFGEIVARGPSLLVSPSSTVRSHWTNELPLLSSSEVVLRELRVSDAPSLFAMLSSEEVARFISPPPTTVEAFEQFIVWTQGEREAGRHVTFGVVPRGLEAAVGLFQVRQMDPSFASATWGFAIGSPFWGTGVFMAGATLVLDFTFDVIGVQRLEARAAVRNGRGNGALRKLGAVCEGLLRRSFLRDGKSLDQHLWSILSDDWKAQRVGTRPTIN